MDPIRLIGFNGGEKGRNGREIPRETAVGSCASSHRSDKAKTLNRWRRREGDNLLGRFLIGQRRC
jgi:hypothetical protein